jgi:putative spermidine/putrescine transport system ATP-binding protein
LQLTQVSSLTLEHIGKRFGDTVALGDVSLEVTSGEFVCLLGESGCGKTTLLRVIAGLETHDQGTLRLADTDLSHVPCHKRSIGMVFQSLALFPHLDVGGNIGYGLKLRGTHADAITARTDELLDTVGLPGFARRTVASLSGGQRQRVAIARALAMEPQLFLMDEPFSALDAGLREHLQHEIRTLQQSLGITTIFVTHDQREAMAIADRIVVLHNGKIEQVASPAEIYQQPRTRYVAEFIGSNNLLDLDVDDHVHLDGLTLGLSPNALKPGRCTVAIRPESIQLAAPGDAADQTATLTGEVLSQRVVGALIEREVKVAGQVIRQTEFQSKTHAMHQALQIGQRVTLSWDWSQAWVLPA